MLEIYDLRSALSALEHAGHNLVRVDEALDPHLDLLDHYLASYRTPFNSWMSAEQPLRLYERPKTGVFPVLLGLFGSRARTAFYLDPAARDGERLSNAGLIHRAIAAPRAPVCRAQASARAVVEHPDLHALLPALTCAPGDPGPTVTLGLVYARDEQTGAANCSVHRITLKPGSVAIAIFPGGHLQRLIDIHVARGQRLPVSINIGLDPAIYLAAALSKPALAFGDDELGVYGALRGRGVELAPCLTNSGRFIDHAEIVIEATLGAEKEFESPAGPDGEALSMPEYLGYFSPCGEVSTLHVSALTHRPGALYQALSGPGREQSELLGAGQEASIFRLLQEQGVGALVREIVAQPAGGGHLLTVIQVLKRCEADDERVRAIAEVLLEHIAATKNLVLVDADVNPYSIEDVMWAMSTRFRADRDIHSTRALRGTPLDPSQSSLYCSAEPEGFTRKSVLDCTVPFSLRARFRRAFC
ncbi:UbiD family decarboxylase domain-containing protein [Pseudomonas sp. Au-Pse12]|uniref:UbiD family decarboxylase domain-containing protein n=1 Tax=Pseudomonas sp. Au-Pse12 TaxID=2906459 RepID=UPI001E58E1C2|nr:UbiD family decarboxylase [Pseudomonas sp. Au-Pse12]MCE4057882.1 UbiD family decarboxylase [Pseudomonas sp. Au-Pse12]